MSVGFLQAPQPTPAPPPGTDIYLVPLSGGRGGGVASMKTAKPVPVSVAPGYDNQPMFNADGTRPLFAANRDGKQTDVFITRGGTRITWRSLSWANRPPCGWRA